MTPKPWFRGSHFALRSLPAFLFIGAWGDPASDSAPTPETLEISPREFHLDHRADRPSFLVQARFADGRTLDVTELATLHCASSEGASSVAAIDGRTLLALEPGDTVLVAEWDGVSDTVPVHVTTMAEAPPVSFRRDVVPVLTKAGCNQGSCHGSSRGQDGFGLSLFGFDPARDYFRITREQPTRRVQLAVPESSLLVEKAIGAVSHTGGQRFEKDCELYRTLVQWLSEGAADDAADVVLPVALEIYPKEVVLAGADLRHRLVVRARYADGSDRDVTALSVFYSSNDHSARVDTSGEVVSQEPGEALVLARFATFTQGVPVVVVPVDSVADRAAYPSLGTIDDLVADRLCKLRLLPAEVCDDATFLRRVSLDVCGVLPTPEEVQRFLVDGTPDKRALVVDELLRRKDFVELWVMKFAELLQIRTDEASGMSAKATLRYFHWLEEALASDEPFDRMVRELLTARGGTFDEPATNFWQVERDTLKLAENVAQSFLGMRIQCAQCHNHPFDRWTMDDYYSFASFFPQVGRKRAEDPRETIVFDQHSGEVNHPVKARPMPPKFLGGAVPDLGDRDRREVLADWLTSPDNPWFARNLANRIWAHFLGVGLVEPVDDVRISNPPSNPALLDHLAESLVTSGFDVRALVREICASRTYQLSSSTPEAGDAEADVSSPLAGRSGARANLRRLQAEVLLDAISQVTRTPNKFPGLPRGARAVQIADGRTSDYFLKTFGRATRESVCSCEVVMEPSLSQALHLLNGSTTVERVREGGLVREWVQSGVSDADLVTQIYLRCFAREPTLAETSAMTAHVPDPADERIAYFEDVFWALLNSKEFLFNH